MGPNSVHMTLSQGKRCIYQRRAAHMLLLVKQVGHTGLAFVEVRLESLQATQGRCQSCGSALEGLAFGS